MDRILPVLLLGFFLGMRHATDADHVLAVSTIVSRERSMRGAGLIGALWGIGHTVTILAVGGAILLFDVVISPRLGLTMEFTVALMLVLLGTMNLTGAMQRIDEVAHAHGPEAHVGAPPQTPEPPAADRFRWFRVMKPLTVGVVHGLAGSAAVALLVLTTIHDATWGLLYLLIFGVGTVAGMILLTSLMAAPLAYGAERFARLNRYMARATGIASVAFGVLIAYRIGIVHGLFSGHPVWDPR